MYLSHIDKINFLDKYIIVKQKPKLIKKLTLTQHNIFKIYQNPPNEVLLFSLLKDKELNQKHKKYQLDQYYLKLINQNRLENELVCIGIKSTEKDYHRNKCHQIDYLERGLSQNSYTLGYVTRSEQDDHIYLVYKHQHDDVYFTVISKKTNKLSCSSNKEKKILVQNWNQN